MARIALYGGSFNPPHQGHLDVLKWLASSDCPEDFNEIWVMPTVNHAFAKDLLDYEIRERMVTAMLAKEFRAGLFGSAGPKDAFKVVRRDAVFMAETLEQLHDEQPGDEFVLVVGADILNETDKWERWDDVVKLATVLPVTRKGVTPPDGWTVHQIEAADPSSTDIRERLGRGDLTYLVGKGADVPEAVLSIIEKEKLYGYAPEAIPQRVRLDTVFIPIETLASKFEPGVVFCLVGDIRKVLGVSAQNHIYDDDTEAKYSFAFRVLRDTAVVSENEREIRRWLQAQTEARTEGASFDTARPQPSSPGLMYLKLGGEPLEGSPGPFVGEADDYAFFEGTSSSGLFGGLFGGLF